MSTVIAWTVASVIVFVCGYQLAQIILTGKFEASGYTICWQDHPLGMALIILEVLCCPLFLISAFYFAGTQSSLFFPLIFFCVYFVGVRLGATKLRNRTTCDPNIRCDCASSEYRQPIENEACRNGMRRVTGSSVQENPMNNVDSGE